ncbi:MAG: thioredoxin [Candidatus Tectomicrobia bacterium]|nr:thioredoxin [Candidatus Tectomicrobia bacterium]
METFTDSNFESEVLSAPALTVVDLTAPWCGPCRMIAPFLTRLAEEYSGRVRFGKVDVDENPGIPKRYEVKSIPTVLLFKQGEVVERIQGAKTKGDYRTAIERHLAA